MGKHKKYKSSSAGLLDAYLSMSNGGATRPSNVTTRDDFVPLPDTMRVNMLLEQLGKERSWLSEEIAQDQALLELQRLYTLHDLRALSADSWRELPLLPLVKDLLRSAIRSEPPPAAVENSALLAADSVDRAVAKTMKKFKKVKKQLKKMKKEGKRQKTMMQSLSQAYSAMTVQDRDAVQDDDSSVAMQDVSQTTAAIPTTYASSSSSSSSSSSNSSDSSDDEQPNKTERSVTGTSLAVTDTPPRPGITSLGANRIRVTTMSGKVFEADRYCPHKHVDLVSRGVVQGESVICTKHDWRFDLCQRGNCLKHRKSINACQVNDW